MKLFFFAIILLFNCTASAQTYTYKPMNLDTSCFWVHDYYSYHEIGMSECSGERTTIVEKDTFMSGYTFQKLITYTSLIGSMSNTMICENFFLKPDGISFIREDTVLHKVYDSGGNVLLDFTKVVGDTMDIGLGIANPPVDSVAINTINGVDRKLSWGVFGVGVHYATIEGIGATHNFPVRGYGEWYNPDYTLKCYSKNGITLYPNNPMDSCVKKPKINVGIKETNLLQIKYTFANNTFQLTDIGNMSLELIVSSIDGAIVFKEKNIHSYYRRDFSNLFSSGLYIFSLKADNKVMNFKGEID